MDFSLAAEFVRNLLIIAPVESKQLIVALLFHGVPSIRLLVSHDVLPTFFLVFVIAAAPLPSASQAFVKEILETLSFFLLICMLWVFIFFDFFRLYRLNRIALKLDLFL